MILGVQDAVDARVIGVGGVHVNGDEVRGVDETIGQLPGGHVGTKVNGGQLVDLGEGLVVDLHDRAWQGHLLQARASEGSVPHRGESRGVSIVVLEGDRLQVAIRPETLLVDIGHARRHPDVLRVGPGEGVAADRRHVVGDRDVRVLALVIGEDSFVVNDEVARHVGVNPHRDGGALGRSCHCRHRGTQRSAAGLFGGREKDHDPVRVGRDLTE